MMEFQGLQPGETRGCLYRHSCGHELHEASTTRKAQELAKRPCARCQIAAELADGPRKLAEMHEAAALDVIGWRLRKLEKDA